MVTHFAPALSEHVNLLGSCNRCGRCCVAMVEGVRFICENLEMTSLGNPEGSRCLVYNKRFDGMPIVMLNDEGDAFVPAVCHKDSEAEVRDILERGIGNGCSYLVQIKEA